MLRRPALVTFASAALLVAACGHQVTPEPSLNGQGNNLTGSILIRFRTVGMMNPSMYDYQIVLDACGGNTPYPNPNTTTYLAYTFSFNVGTSPFGVSTTFPILLQYIVTPGTQNQLNPQIVRTSVSEATLTPNDNGQGNEFTLVFPRALLNAPLGPSALPCSSSLVSPAPVPVSPTPTSTATSTTSPPVPSPTGTSPSPSPSPTGTSPAAPTNLANTWKFNFFTINASSGQVLDSLGTGGPTDTSYNQAVIDTTTTNQTPIIKQTDITGAPSDPAAAIAGGEIDNYL